MQASFDNLLQQAVEEGVAPGVVGVAFNRNEIVAQSAKGLSTLETKKPMENDTPFWFASMSKAVTATVCLAVVEELNFDIDSHEALVKYLPEIAKTPGNPFWTIFDKKDADGNWTTREATVPCTLRHFLTHTSGVPYPFSSHARSWYYDQTPNPRMDRRKIDTLFGPREFEAGEKWLYGENCEIYGIFTSRATGKNWTQLLQEYINKPLNIPASSFTILRTPQMDAKLQDMKYKVGDKQFIAVPFEINGHEGEVPKDEYEFTGGNIWGDLKSYAIFAQSLLNGHKGILSEKMFKRASEDDLALRGLSILQDGSQPFMPVSDLKFACEFDHWNTPHPSLGWTLLNTLYNRADADNGIHKGTLQWSGAANSFYFVDPVSGVGGVFGCNSMPFGYPEALAFRQKFETWVEKNVSSQSTHL